MVSTSQIFLIREMFNKLRHPATLPKFYAKKNIKQVQVLLDSWVTGWEAGVEQPFRISHVSNLWWARLLESVLPTTFPIVCVIFFLFQGIPLCIHLLPGHIYSQNPPFTLTSFIMKISPNLSWFGKISWWGKGEDHNISFSSENRIYWGQIWVFIVNKASM